MFFFLHIYKIFTKVVIFFCLFCRMVEAIDEKKKK